MSMRLIKWTCANCSKISSKLTSNIARKQVHKFSFSCAPVALNEGQGHSNWSQTVDIRVTIIIPGSQEWQHQFSVLPSLQHQLFPVITKFSLSCNINMFNLNYYNILSNYILISWEMCKSTNQTGFVFRWPWGPQPHSNDCKWFMVPLNMVGQKALHWKFCAKCPAIKFPSMWVGWTEIWMN